MPMLWLRAHLYSLPQIMAEAENLAMTAASFPHMKESDRKRHVRGLEVRLAGAWTTTREGVAYDHRGYRLLQGAQDVRRWFRSLGW